MEDNINIEELFKSALENVEADPGAGAWQAIQAKMGAAAAGSGASAVASKTLGAAKFIKAALIVAGIGGAATVGYIAFIKPKAADKAAVENNTRTITEQPAQTNAQEPVKLSDDVSFTEINSVNKPGKVVSVIELQKGNEKQKVLVEIYEPVKNTKAGNSVVAQFLSQKNNNKASQDLAKKLLQQIENDEKNPVVETPESKTDASSVRRMDEYEVYPGIKTSIAGLTVDFTNVTRAESYEWNFGDNTGSKEAAPHHTYTEPGLYVVSLSIKDKNGKTYTDKLPVEVKAGDAATTAQGEPVIETVNILTPNGDGRNDVAVFKGKNISSFEMQVFDQKGTLVFSTDDITQPWDGTDKRGQALANGNYVCEYSAMGTNGKPVAGRVMIRLVR